MGLFWSRHLPISCLYSPGSQRNGVSVRAGFQQGSLPFNWTEFAASTVTAQTLIPSGKRIIPEFRHLGNYQVFGAQEGGAHEKSKGCV